MQKIILLCLISQLFSTYINTSQIVNQCHDDDQICKSNISVSVGFEVYGKVQGVHFRKYTQIRAVELGLMGYVQNTKYGSVIGVMQGSLQKIQQMKQWLQTVGSPQSRIDETAFKDERQIDEYDFSGFQIKK